MKAWRALIVLAALGACDGGAGSDAGVDGGDATTSQTWDVVVVGATAGGIAAAIEASRVGAHVVVLEETDVIGGQFATQAVGPADDPGFNSSSGIYAELRAAAASHYAALGKTFIRAIEPHVAVQLFGDMLAKAGVTVVLRARVDALQTSGNVVTGVHATTHDGALAITSKIVIDATDTGDVVALSPARYRAGNRTSDALDPTACVQDLTYGVVIKHYPGGAPAELLVTTKPPGYDPAPFQAFLQKTGWGWDQFVRYRALPDSSSSASDWDGGADLSTITRTIVNAYNDAPMTAGDLDRSARKNAYCNAKLVTMRALYFINTEIGHTDWAIANDEGYDTPYNLEEGPCPNVPPELRGIEKYFPPTPYVREGRRAVGITTLTASQEARLGVYPNTVGAHAFHSAGAIDDYAFDLHGCSDESTLESGLETLTDVPGASPGVYSPGSYGPFEVPIEALVPELVDGLLVAEKNISVSRLVNGATRVHPDVMHNGMAAGALAGIAIMRNAQPRAVPAIVVQDRLVRDTSALALQTYGDVARDAGVSWSDIQIASTYEIMQAADAGSFDPSSVLTRGASAIVLKKLFALPDFMPTTPTFADVPQSRADYGAIESIFQAGLTSGCGGGNFCPDIALTRGAMATFVVKAMAIDPTTAPQTPLYLDVPADGGTLGEFPFIQIFGQKNLLDPCAPNMFCPAASITRAEAAQVVRRVLLARAP